LDHLLDRDLQVEILTNLNKYQVYKPGAQELKLKRKVVMGIDLAGKFENPTGFCSMTEEGTETKLLFTDEEIIDEVNIIKPECIAIDAPFWLPTRGAWRIDLPWRIGNRSQNLGILFCHFRLVQKFFLTRKLTYG
jgi:hypothetical protein